MRTIITFISLGLALAALLDAQSLRRDRDLARTEADALAIETLHAWRLVHQLRATLAAHDGPLPDPAAGIQFLDN